MILKDHDEYPGLLKEEGFTLIRGNEIQIARVSLVAESLKEAIGSK